MESIKICDFWNWFCEFWKSSCWQKDTFVSLFNGICFQLLYRSWITSKNIPMELFNHFSNTLKSIDMPGCFILKHGIYPMTPQHVFPIPVKLFQTSGTSPPKPGELSPLKGNLRPLKGKLPPLKVRHSPKEVSLSPLKVRHSPSKVRLSPLKVRHLPKEGKRLPKKLRDDLSKCKKINQ